MTIWEFNDLKTRFNALHDMKNAFNALYAGEDSDIWFTTLLRMPYREANLQMSRLEAKDNELNDINTRIRKRDELIRQGMNEAINNTNWSMLPDAPLSQEGKTLYRAYRTNCRGSCLYTK